MIFLFYLLKFQNCSTIKENFVCVTLPNKPFLYINNLVVQYYLSNLQIKGEELTQEYFRNQKYWNEIFHKDDLYVALYDWTFDLKFQNSFIYFKKLLQNIFSTLKTDIKPKIGRRRAINAMSNLEFCLKFIETSYDVFKSKLIISLHHYLRTIKKDNFYSHLNKYHILLCQENNKKYCNLSQKEQNEKFISYIEKNKTFIEISYDDLFDTIKLTRFIWKKVCSKCIYSAKNYIIIDINTDIIFFNYFCDWTTSNQLEEVRNYFAALKKKLI